MGDFRLEKTSGKLASRAELKEKVLSLREEGMEQKDIAEEVGVSQPTVSRILRGDFSTVTASTKPDTFSLDLFYKHWRKV
jgi:predicted XRE-type DNA-binding protein